ncbi:MAG: 1-deoxy-D-xylulose-5-phosphate reductoisomerase [Gammaproteobacteria bacterium]|nr:MAG: 1-deoxy-D-xylulose-5-phosphate reductoisomerase [Gammaproteobacteria bacterium]
MTASENKKIVVLGSTGSIGVSTLDVIRRHPGMFDVFALVANRSVETIFQQCLEFEPEYAALRDGGAAEQLHQRLVQAKCKTQVLNSEDEVAQLASHSDVDYVMAAIVGAAGLKPSLAAVKAGKRVLLANKEALVMAGRLFMAEVEASGAQLLPVDSEHNAIFQCLDTHRSKVVVGRDVRRVLLTASGGPFRKLSLQELDSVTPEQAIAHPNWSMGKKISVDSATLMNKGLELIEACWLFDVTPAQVEVHIHPESIVHSMVEYLDGSVLAQLGSPDMRTPIAYGLGFPERISSGVSSLDLFKLGTLTFEKPDLQRFPSLALAAEAFISGGAACAVLNAANEVAVEAFLNRRIGFLAIAQLVEAVLAKADLSTQDSLERITAQDRWARNAALDWVERNRTGM